MFTVILSAVALAAGSPGTPSTVEISEPRATFVQSVAEDGSVILTGQYHNSGQRFRYKVKDGKVTGWVGGKPVKFPTTAIERLLR